MPRRLLLVTVYFLLVGLGNDVHTQNQGAAEVVFEQAVSDFERGLVDEAAVGFDTVAELLPRQAPHLWQRGIALYYAARYDDCREQFESHRTVNPNDVENAVWHFLCVARSESAEVARTQLLPVGPDGRVPMREVYQMFKGTLMPMQVLNAAGNDPSGQFFAHLYLGLYFEALKKPMEALDHIQRAAADRYSRVGGYMHMVARVHLNILQRP